MVLCARAMSSADQNTISPCPMLSGATARASAGDAASVFCCVDMIDHGCMPTLTFSSTAVSPDGPGSITYGVDGGMLMTAFGAS